MTNRERFHAVLSADPTVDRTPVMEWAIWWDETIKAWENEGMPKGMGTLELYDYFGLDRSIQFWFPHYAEGYPYKCLHEISDVNLEDGYNQIKKYLYPKDAVNSMKERIENAMLQHKSGQSIVWFTVEGFFWFPRQLFGIEEHLYSFYDHPDLYHRICEDLLEWQLGVVEEFSSYMKADFMTIAEDMSYNHGSMISEDIFEEFIAPYYKRLIPEIKKHGTRVIIDSDGDISEPVEWFECVGIEGILPLERQAGVDIAVLQEKHPNFLWLGGFDKMCLFKDKAAIDDEFKRILPMLRKGRFIPSVDHQTPPGVPIENYRYYVKRFHELSTQACKDG